MKHKFKLVGLISILVVGFYGMNSCVGLPDGIKPVEGFQKDKYLGTWYEIARLDHSFERGLSQVSAEYTVKEDGGLKVVNRGYDAEKGEWSEAVGKAYFVKSPDVGHLKVSFFGPFYGSYAVFELDEKDYNYAYITSYNKDYLWFLSRTPTVSEAEKKQFIDSAQKLGFDVESLIFVDHEKK
ncbi:MAG: lipocalin family protein [Akkermansiaceae bacterium]